MTDASVPEFALSSGGPEDACDSEGDVTAMVAQKEEDSTQNRAVPEKMRQESRRKGIAHAKARRRRGSSSLEIVHNSRDSGSTTRNACNLDVVPRRTHRVPRRSMRGGSS